MSALIGGFCRGVELAVFLTTVEIWRHVTFVVLVPVGGVTVMAICETAAASEKEHGIINDNANVRYTTLYSCVFKDFRAMFCT